MTHSATNTFALSKKITRAEDHSTLRERESANEDCITKPMDTVHLIAIIYAQLLRAEELNLTYPKKTYLGTMKLLANAVESRDRFTFGHVERVAEYASWLGEALAWSPSHMQTLAYGALLHDIGKMLVPDYILNKPGALSDEEWALMKQHPLNGAKLLEKITVLQETLPYIMYHHEKWDGTGYPYGLEGEAIPIEGRLLAIADVFDALTSVRPYRQPLPFKEAIQCMQRGLGTYFDPYLLGAFFDVVVPRYVNRLK
ncbi:MAG: hypothetical protein Fur0022_09060 [Anaerolineales bacterium]